MVLESVETHWLVALV